MTTFRIVFKESGSYEFVCRIYTWMKGKVEVIDNFESQEQESNPMLVRAAINSEKESETKFKKS